MKKGQAIVLVIAMLMSIMPGMAAKAYTQPVTVNTGIGYPISLSSGKDKKGSFVIPDANFRSYLAKETFRSGYYRGESLDLNHDGQLSQEECDLVRVLEINGRKEISSVEGIAAFPKLRELRCGKTGIKRLDVSYNTWLQELSVYGNELKKLDVSKCPQLTSLTAHSCSISCLVLSGNPNLTYLSVENQTRKVKESRVNGNYVVDLHNLDSQMDIGKIADVKIDGAAGDGTRSVYDADTGKVTCSDQMEKITYQYHTGCKENALKEGKELMEVTVYPDLSYVEESESDREYTVPESTTKPDIKDPYNGEEEEENISSDITIYYEERGGSKVADRTIRDRTVVNLLPTTKTKRKNYIFAGWKCMGKKVTKKTAASELCDEGEDSITLTAVWHKKYEKKGKKFTRYGCRYQIVQSDKKGQKVQLIGAKKKTITLQNKVFYNGRKFTLSKIKKKALKKVRVKVRVPKKFKKKYIRMVKKAGGICRKS